MSAPGSPHAGGAAAEPDWLRLQKKIFGRYVQQKLREGGIKKEINDLVKQLDDGVILIELIQCLSGKDFGKKPQAAKLRIQQIEGINQALKFATNAGVNVKSVHVSAEDFVDHKENQVLALIFQIIMKYLKFEEDEEGKQLDIRDALTLWLNNKTSGHSGFKIEDLTKSFHNGMAFLALIHKMRPNLVNYEALDASDKTGNLELALTLGEKYLGIEKYVTAADILKLNEISMIVYLSDWYHGIFLLQKQDIAARRIGKLVNVTELHDKMRAEYKQRSAAILAWLNAKIAALNKREFDDTMGGIRHLLDAFYAYKKGEKGEQISAQQDAAALFGNLALRLAKHKRPAFHPPAGTSPPELDSKFEELEECEAKRSVALYTELARQVHLQKVDKRFRAANARLLEWVGEKKPYVSTVEAINSVEDAEEALENLGLYDGEAGHMLSANVKDLNGLGDELVKERYEKSSEVTKIMHDIKHAFEGLASAAQSKRGALTKALADQKDLNDRLCRAFADSMKSWTEWLKGKKSALAASSSTALDHQLKEVEKWLADRKEAEDKLHQLEGHDQKVQARGLVNNPHTSVSLGDARSQWEQFILLLAKKKSLLEEQLEESKRQGLTKEQMQEIDDNFNFFDKDRNGRLTRPELKVCLQSLGEESTPKDIAAILTEYDPKKNGFVLKEDFTRFMFKILGDSDTEEELVKSFKYLSYDKEYLLKEELSNVVNGKTFKDHHVAYLNKEMKPKDAGLDFLTWNHEAFSR